MQRSPESQFHLGPPWHALKAITQSGGHCHDIGVTNMPDNETKNEFDHKHQKTVNRAFDATYSYSQIETLAEIHQTCTYFEEIWPRSALQEWWWIHQLGRCEQDGCLQHSFSVSKKASTKSVFECHSLHTNSEISW